MMKNIKYLFLFVATVFLLNSCEDGMPETSDLNYVTFEATGMDLGVTIEGSSEHDILVYTTQITGSDRTFNLKVNTESTTAEGGAYSVPATVTVPANSNVGTFKLGLNDVNIGDGKDLVIELEVEPGVFKGEATTIAITQICDKNEVIIKVTFDDYGSECSWQLTDAADQVVASGSGYADGDAGASKKLCIVGGTYTFTVADAYGDGLGAGGVSIISNGAEVVNIPGDFGAGTSVSFDVN